MMSTNMRPGVSLRRQAWAGLVVLVMALAGAVGFGLRDRQAEAQAKPVLVFAAASLKNALDDITAQYERETGRQGQRLRRRQPGARPPDRVRRAGGPVHLGRPGLDGLPPDAKSHQDRDARQAGREPARTRRAQDQHRHGHDRTRPVPDRAPRRRPPGHGRPQDRARRQVRACRPRVARHLAERREPPGPDRERPRGARAVSRGETPLGIVYQTDAAADPKVRIAGTFPENSIRPSSTRSR